MTSPSPKRAITALGPGTLSFGAVASPLDISCQVTACSISAEGSSEDSTPTLCGGEIAGERLYVWTLAFTAYQDLELNGLIDWTWKNAGAEVPFTFTPKTEGDATVTGKVLVDPATLGGDVKKKNTSECNWTCVGTPAFVPDVLAEGATVPAGE